MGSVNMNNNEKEKSMLYLTKDGYLNITHGTPFNPTIKHMNIIESSPHPIKFSIETATDWPIVIATLIVGIGSVITTIFVARISYMNQKFQIRSNIASFRQKWQDELRNTTAEYFSHVTQIHQNKKNNGQGVSPEINGELIRLHAKLELLFDKSKYTEIEKLIENVTDLSLKGDDEFYNEINTLHYAINEVLEKAWEDIKNDLRGISPN